MYYNDEIRSDLELMTATATEEQIAKFTLRAGDTVITKDSETADDIAVSAFVRNDLPGVVCGYHLSVVRPYHAAVGSFVKRLFDASYTRACCAVRANGLTRVGLGQYALDNLELPWPPEDEQLGISAFLDRETARLDALIAEQQRLIELLTEKRQAVISHAVTKGLNPDAPMKPSGVEWLGNVPAHWEVLRVKTVSSRTTSGPRGWSERLGDDGALFVQSGDLNDTLGLGLDDVRDTPVFLPPLPEQRTIIESIHVHTRRLDALAVDARRAIDLLQERRTALISAAVTGQIDVRPESMRQSA